MAFALFILIISLGIGRSFFITNNEEKRPEYLRDGLNSSSPDVHKEEMSEVDVNERIKDLWLMHQKMKMIANGDSLLSSFSEWFQSQWKDGFQLFINFESKYVNGWEKMVAGVDKMFAGVDKMFAGYHKMLTSHITTVTLIPISVVIFLWFLLFVMSRIKK